MAAGSKMPSSKCPGSGHVGKIFWGSRPNFVLVLLELTHRVCSVALAESEDERRISESIGRSRIVIRREDLIGHHSAAVANYERKRRIVESIRLWREEDRRAGVGSGPWSFPMLRPLRPRGMSHPILSVSLARPPIWYAVHFYSPTAMSSLNVSTNEGRRDRCNRASRTIRVKGCRVISLVLCDS